MLSTLIKYLPTKLRNSAYHYLRQSVVDLNYQQKVHSNYPKTNFSAYANLTYIKNRIELLNYLPQNAVCAEIGVDYGFFSHKILENTNPFKLHLIDSWESERYSKKKHEKLKNDLRYQIKDEIIEIHVGVSYLVANTFNDHYFDWVYIDTDHSYETTKRELISFQPKIKENGFICGHDFREGNWNEWYRYGVIEAVEEFCQEYSWEIKFLTLDRQESPSFALSKK